jgi:hypothetical protein
MGKKLRSSTAENKRGHGKKGDAQPRVIPARLFSRAIFDAFRDAFGMP